MTDIDWDKIKEAGWGDRPPVSAVERVEFETHMDAVDAKLRELVRQLQEGEPDKPAPAPERVPEVWRAEAGYQELREECANLHEEVGKWWAKAQQAVKRAEEAERERDAARQARDEMARMRDEATKRANRWYGVLYRTAMELSPEDDFLLDNAPDAVRGLKIHRDQLWDRVQETERERDAAAKRAEEAERERDSELQLSEDLKVALRMPGTGNYVEWARKLRDAWERRSEPPTLTGDTDVVRQLCEAVDSDVSWRVESRARHFRDAIREGRIRVGLAPETEELLESADQLKHARGGHDVNAAVEASGRHTRTVFAWIDAGCPDLPKGGG